MLWTLKAWLPVFSITCFIFVPQPTSQVWVPGGYFLHTPPKWEFFSLSHAHVHIKSLHYKKVFPLAQSIRVNSSGLVPKHDRYHLRCLTPHHPISSTQQSLECNIMPIWGIRKLKHSKVTELVSKTLDLKPNHPSTTVLSFLSESAHQQ